MTPCDMGAAMVDRFAALGVQYLLCRSIGYDHVDRARAKAHGMRVANVGYTPNGVANYAIMLMLMATRRMGHILKRAEVQDYSLKGKDGERPVRLHRGRHRRGQDRPHRAQTPVRLCCKLLAYDVYQNPEAAALAEFVPLRSFTPAATSSRCTPTHRRKPPPAGRRRLWQNAGRRGSSSTPPAAA